GKSKSSLYYYYTSKEEIFDAVLERETGDVLVRMRQAVDREKTAQAKLTAFCLTKIKAIRQKIMLYAIMSQELQHQPEFMLCARQRHEKQERELMLSLLNYGITTGEFSFLSEQNLDLFTFALLNSLEGLEEQAVLRNNFDLVESAVPLLTQVLARGLKA
ncbi:MAG TPA: TetR/AcrR family transcriptional regulator, partial [Hymenobacter sp.]